MANDTNDIEDAAIRGIVDVVQTLKIDSAARVERNVSRCDRGTARRKKRYDEQTGFVHLDMSVTKAPAVFVYMNRDGTRRREFRPAEHVFSADNMERMANSEITLGHPPVSVTTKNRSRYSVGHSDGSRAVEDGHFWTGAILKEDSVIDAVGQGVIQTSGGYSCSVVMQPGIYVDAAGVGHPYDAIQTDHKHNHTAILPLGRAETTGLSVDRFDAVQVTDEENMADKEDKKHEPAVEKPPVVEVKKGRVTIDGVGLELPLEEAKVVADAMRGLAAKSDALEAERDAHKIALDAAEAKAKEALSDDQLNERVNARRALLDKAATFIVDETELEAVKTKTDMEVKQACIAAANPEGVSLEGKSDEYVNAMFDLLKPQKEDEMSRAGRVLVGAKSRDSEGHSLLSTRIDGAIEKADTNYKFAIPGGMTADGKTGSRTDELHG